MLPARPSTWEGDLFGKSFSCGVSARMACRLAIICLPAGSFLGALLRDGGLAFLLDCACAGLWFREAGEFCQFELRVERAKSQEESEAWPSGMALCFKNLKASQPSF